MDMFIRLAAHFQCRNDFGYYDRIDLSNGLTERLPIRESILEGVCKADPPASL